MVVFVSTNEEEIIARGTALADHLGVPVVSEPGAIAGEKLYLKLDGEGLLLTDGTLEMKGDFAKLEKRLNRNNLLHEMIVKAARIKGNDSPVAVDATAGMGEDSFLLAAAGFRVTMFEYDPVIFALLSDALRRAQENEKLRETAMRMEVFEGDSIDALRKMSNAPDVVILDPMFPERQKSGLIKKKFQLLQQLESPCGNEEELFEAALAAHPKKIVIKRPLKGPYLAGVKPDYSSEGKAIRYDCVLPRSAE